MQRLPNAFRGGALGDCASSVRALHSRVETVRSDVETMTDDEATARDYLRVGGHVLSVAFAVPSFGATTFAGGIQQAVRNASKPCGNAGKTKEI